MKKKLICFSLISSLFVGSLSLLAGCNKPGTSSPSDEPSESLSESTQESSSLTETISPSVSESDESSPSVEESSPSEESSPDTTPIVPETFYTVANGQFSEVDGTLTSKDANSLAFKNEGVFEEGTLSCDIKLNGNMKDNGLIFGLKNNNMSVFWENPNIYYYFFFINSFNRRNV